MFLVFYCATGIHVAASLIFLSYIFGLGSPFPGVATPRGRQSQHRSYIFQQRKKNSIARIYFSRTASRIYISAEQQRPYILRENSIVCSYTHPGSGDPWEWRPVTIYSVTLKAQDRPISSLLLLIFNIK